MSIFRNLLFAEIRGMLGGTVYSRNRSGPYSRTRGTIYDPATPPQVNARDRFVFLNDRWAALSDDQRVSWNVYADLLRLQNSLGQPSRISGKAAYLRFNNLRYNSSQVSYLLDNPPSLSTFAPAPVLSNFSAVWDVSDNRLVYSVDAQCLSAPPTPIAGDYICCYISDPRATTHYVYHRSWTFLGYIVMGQYSWQPRSCTHYDTRTIWNVAGGEACFAKLVVSHKDGRISVPALARCITTSQA